ncbi:MAG: hypothetical protein A3K19_28675 [Lentisphaerae bacterium RIFOXYB12_FULL_65_16]|nr:MAG: hypothetical protein A3K18_25215 [Lentisphaerae bacterium RIFOXYA12_64_32]OGV89686.1 MAG: hypothetical protein A3K19_28675 [Lentisphaerae bacterium RIFOXYB12_FULL_65_16]
MKSELRKMLTVALGVGLLAGATPWASAQAKDAKAAEKQVQVVDDKAKAGDEGAVKEVEDKLLKLTSLEDAFAKAMRNRELLRRFIVQENAKLTEAANEEGKAEIQKNLDEGKKRLQTIVIAMDIVFGIGNRRDYEYNNVTSTVYLKVGTVEEAFARSVRTRDALAKFVGEQEKLAETEKDEAKKTEINGKIETAKRQHQIVAAALQVIFGVTPQRNYLYDPKEATLYLKVTETEAEKVKAQLLKLQEERAEKEKADKAAAEKK